MGQTSSSGASTPHSGGGTSASTPAKTCYYELLSIERTATQDEIKKAYRKKAFELHPDRNFNDVERATRLFAEIQTAHEVLSDPEERAWYDSHREAILRGHDSNSTTSRPIDVTTSEDVLSWVTRFSVRMPLDDSAGGFFARARRAFETLAMEEEAAARAEGEDLLRCYPGFGSARDTYESGHVREFYLEWTGFASQKSFAWCDVYRYSDAPDRRVKRAMEKDNMRARETARREFNDTVVSFVKFVRKRDPRFTPNSQTEKERQEALLKLSREQAARQRKENAMRRNEYKAADWARVVSEGEEGYIKGDDDETESEEESEEEVVERWECIVCKKVFWSQGQMDAHEKSKKHVKAVQQLKRQMMKENKEFDLDRDVRGREKQEEEFTPMDGESDVEDLLEQEEKDRDQSGDALDKVADPTLIAVPDHETGSEETSPTQTPESERAVIGSENDEYASAEKFEARVLGVGDGLSSGLASTTLSDAEDSRPITKMGKAKAKRSKRAQKAVMAREEEKASDFNCSSCREYFPSKTKLFSHLKENPSHAKLVPVNGSGTGGKKNKGKRQ